LCFQITARYLHKNYAEADINIDVLIRSVLKSQEKQEYGDGSRYTSIVG
jgi:hypothetical protein